MERSKTLHPIILLVEDYVDSRQMLKLLLESVGYRVLTAPNGKIASTIATNESVDLILTDFDLPDMTGTTLVRNLRRIKKELADVPFVVITANDGEEYRRLSYQAGCSAFLNKPIDFELLIKILAQVVPQRGSDFAQSATSTEIRQPGSLEGNENVNVDPLPTSL